MDDVNIIWYHFKNNKCDRNSFFFQYLTHSLYLSKISGTQIILSFLPFLKFYLFNCPKSEFEEIVISKEIINITLQKPSSPKYIVLSIEFLVLHMIQYSTCTTTCFMCIRGKSWRKTETLKCTYIHNTYTHAPSLCVIRVKCKWFSWFLSPSLHCTVLYMFF